VATTVKLAVWPRRNRLASRCVVIVRRHWCRIYRQRCRRAGDCPRRVAHHHSKARSIVCRRRRRRGVARCGGPGDIHSALLPLVAQRRGARRLHREARRPARRNRLLAGCVVIVGATGAAIYRERRRRAGHCPRDVAHHHNESRSGYLTSSSRACVARRGGPGDVTPLFCHCNSAARCPSPPP